MLWLLQAEHCTSRSTLQTKVRNEEVFSLLLFVLVVAYPHLGLNDADTRTGGAPVTSFVYRACVIQGTQQIYVVALWYWGAALAKAQGKVSVVANLNSYPKIIVPVCIIVACVMWIAGAVLFVGLPTYFRQTPGNIPSFYPSLFRRKIIIVGSYLFPLSFYCCCQSS